MHNAPPAYVEALAREPMIRPPPDVPLGRVAVTKQVAQIADIKTTQSYIERHPFVFDSVELAGKSYALIMYDPEGRGGLGVVHWVAYGIPASVTGFAEGDTSQQVQKYVGGKSTMNLPHYFGPCTPAGGPAPLYVHADRQAGMTRDELMKALDGHAKGATGIIGTFSRP
jgi:phosphatidylethanolamine-binding protein (PEBP) family uncharacterized protein